MKDKVLIGLLGTIGSGKTTISDYLVKKGFYRVIMGNLVREKAKKEGLLAERRNLQEIQRKYRRTYGRNFFIKEALRKLHHSGRKLLLIDGIRTPADATYARKNGAKLIFIDASKKSRYRRLLRRAREGENKKSFAEFLEDDAREFKLFSFRKTLRYVDYKLHNNSTMKDANARAEKLLGKILNEKG